MFFKTGDLAEFMGMTNMGILYLEKRGIIQSVRDTNGYRLYSPETVTQLGIIRSYERAGFSLAEAVDLTCKDASDVQDALFKKKAELTRQLEIISGFEKPALPIVTDASGLTAENICIKQRPVFYYCPVWEDVYDMSVLPSDVQHEMRHIDISWLASIPYMRYCSKIVVENNRLTFERGNRILQSDALRERVYLSEKWIQTVPECTCLNFFYEGEHPHDIILSALAYIAQLGKKYTNPIFTPLFNLNFLPNSNRVLQEVFIPLEI